LWIVNFAWHYMVIDKIEILWKDFETRLWSFIFSKVPDKAATDDILQEVFIKIHLKIDTLKDESKLKPWLYQITRNLIMDYYRRNKPANHSPLTLDEEAKEESDSKVMDEALRDMIGMMGDLPPEYCEALCLTELEGLSQKEYAQRIGIPYSSAKSRVQRSRKLLKDMLMRCCHYEFDKYGTILSISQNCCCCSPKDSSVIH
jgi:RNA polymerase sigma-70 factor, ECF subfamily